MLNLYAAEIVPYRQSNPEPATRQRPGLVESAKTVPEPGHVTNFDQKFPLMIFEFNAFLIKGASILSSFLHPFGRKIKTLPIFFPIAASVIRSRK